MKFTTILCLLFASLSVVDSLAIRAKIGKAPVKAKPAAAKPVAAKKPAAAKPVTAKKPTVAKPAASVCNGISACLACTKNTACAFNSDTLKCGARTSTAAPLVTNAKLCPPLKQAAQIAPEAAVAQQAKAKFAAMEKHIFLNNKIPKTVFDDRAGGFTQSDVQQMCTTAITLNIQENGAVKV
ncbi:hypothetical protein C8J57DRAFT_1372220 [Mycena rebaudengoi]|nr:hypothetical protein C8J57DRAFT_1372220 [Mycena rebaudengoi]